MTIFIIALIIVLIPFGIIFLGVKYKNLKKVPNLEAVVLESKKAISVKDKKGFLTSAPMYETTLKLIYNGEEIQTKYFDLNYQFNEGDTIKGTYYPTFKTFQPKNEFLDGPLAVGTEKNTNGPMVALLLIGIIIFIPLMAILYTSTKNNIFALLTVSPFIILCITYGLSEIKTFSDMKKDSVEIKGKVVDILRKYNVSSDAPSGEYYKIYEYEINGKKYLHQARFGIGRTFGGKKMLLTIGEECILLYSKNMNRIEEKTRFNGMIPIGLINILIGIGLLALVMIF